MGEALERINKMFNAIDEQLCSMNSAKASAILQDWNNRNFQLSFGFLTDFCLKMNKYSKIMQDPTINWIKVSLLYI